MDIASVLRGSPQGMGPISQQMNTQLTPEQYAQYMQAFGQRAPGDEKDYDLRGAWLAGARPGPNGHFTDQFKKPNHPTFSGESQYSNAQHPGGYWTDNTFVPSADMYSDSDRMAQLIRYMRGPAENGNYFMVPPTIAAPQGR